MSQDKFLALIDQLCEFSSTILGEKYTDYEIHVIGGEPTMLGYDFFTDVFEASKLKLSKIDKEVRFTLVTNLLSDDALKIAKLFDTVSTSYEPDSRFLTFAGAPKPGLQRKWEKNVRLAIESGMDLQSTSGITLGNVNYGAVNLIEYMSELGFKGLHLGFFIPSGDGKTYAEKNFPEFEQTSQFLIDAFDWNLEHRGKGGIYLNPIESLIYSIYTNEACDDIVCPIIPGSLDVDWDGETTSCIEAGGEVDFKSLGNVFKEDGSSISEILTSRDYRKVKAKAMRRPKECEGCPEIAVCQYACGVLHDWWDKDGECPGFKRFLQHARHHVENLGVRPLEEKVKSQTC